LTLTPSDSSRAGIVTPVARNGPHTPLEDLSGHARPYVTDGAYNIKRREETRHGTKKGDE
jgi:hypothetical protein